MPERKPTETPAGPDDERITRELAQTAMGWRIAPGRFLKPGRGWLPHWRFQPVKRLDHALELLNKTDNYTITSGKLGRVRVIVHIGKRAGAAEDRCLQRAITYAVARAVGIDVSAIRGEERDEIAWRAR